MTFPLLSTATNNTLRFQSAQTRVRHPEAPPDPKQEALDKTVTQMNTFGNTAGIAGLLAGICTDVPWTEASTLLNQTVWAGTMGFLGCMAGLLSYVVTDGTRKGARNVKLWWSTPMISREQDPARETLLQCLERAESLMQKGTPDDCGEALALLKRVDKGFQPVLDFPRLYSGSDDERHANCLVIARTKAHIGYIMQQGKNGEHYASKQYVPYYMKAWGLLNEALPVIDRVRFQHHFTNQEDLPEMREKLSDEIEALSAEDAEGYQLAINVALGLSDSMTKYPDVAGKLATLALKLADYIYESGDPIFIRIAKRRELLEAKAETNRLKSRQTSL